MFESTYTKDRLQKACILRENGLNPYRNDAKKSISSAKFNKKYAYLKDVENKKDTEIHHVTGRVKLLRMMGKACFFTIEDGSFEVGISGTLQIYASYNDLGDDFALLKKCLEVGDFVNIAGYAFVTKTNELSLHCTSFKLLTKSINPLPEKFHGITDIELRYRARYLDLIMNSEVREVFYLRTKIISCIRKFFESKGFLEVETPMLHPIPGGANARSFITHHNALDVSRYLRIAPELYLKRLIVGGFEAVFEINRNFRNEGMDHSHNPEFTMLEFYWAYKNYFDLIDLTKELFGFLLSELHMNSVQKYGDFEIDFLDFKIMTYKQAITHFGKLDVEIIESSSKLLERIAKDGANTSDLENSSHGKILEAAFEHYAEPNLINPTFITEYPIEISPLARRSDKDPNIADRFEFFIAGKEIANGFSELNDPVDQFERFKEQVALKDAGDDEAQFMDEDYVNALGYGMPPTAGQGIGIDRLVMLLTGSRSIKDVILFPAMK